MANAAKELRIDITGNSDRFGEAVKKAESYVNELQKSANNKLSGGLIAGGVAGFAEKTVDALFEAIRKVESVIERARQLNISNGGLAKVERYGSLVGATPEATDTAVQKARQVRADALAGDDQAALAFERIGLALDDIRSLKPDELFFRILKAAREQELTAQRYFAFSRVLGEGFAAAALPVASSPRAAELAEQTAFSRWGQIANYIPGGMQYMGVYDQAKEKVAKARNNFEPFSSFGIAQQEQGEFLAEQNRQKILLVGRSQLSTEERINEVIAERLRIARLISEEQDPIKRQKFIADGIAVEAELSGLTTRRATELRAPAGKLGTDPLRSIGADFSRFSPTLATTLQAQTNTEIRTLRRSLEVGLQKLEAVLSNEGP